MDAVALSMAGNGFSGPGRSSNEFLPRIRTIYSGGWRACAYVVGSACDFLLCAKFRCGRRREIVATCCGGSGYCEGQRCGEWLDSPALDIRKIGNACACCV